MSGYSRVLASPVAVARQKMFSWQMPLIAVVTALGAFAGLAIPILGLDSLAAVLIAVCGLGTAVSFGAIVYFAARSRPWAISIFLSLAAFLVDAIFRQREITAQGIDAQTLLKLTIWCAGFVIAYFTIPRPFSALFQGDLKWLSAFSFFALFGTIYSLTPAYTFGAGFAAVAYCALAVCVVEKLQRVQILYALLMGLSVLLLLSLLMYSVGGGLAVMEGGAVLRLGGIAGSPNGLGRAAALAILVVGVLVMDHRLSFLSWPCLIPLFVALMCLLLSDSRTSMLAVVFAFALHFLRRHLVLAYALLLVCTVAALLVLSFDISWYQIGSSLSRTGRFSELTTLTGRTDIWAVSWKAFLERPILGYGFGSTKVLLPEIYRTYWGFTVTHAHNLYLQAAVTTGLIGLSLILLIVFRQVVVLIKKPSLFQTVVLGYILIQGLTEPGPIGTSPNLITLFWALGLCWDRGRDEPYTMHFPAKEQR